MKKLFLLMVMPLFLFGEAARKTDTAWRLDAKFDDRTVIQGNVSGSRVVLRKNGQMRVFRSRALQDRECQEIISEIREDPRNAKLPGLDDLCVLPMDEMGKIVFFVTTSIPDKDEECRLGVCAWKDRDGKWTMGVWSLRTLGWEKKHPGESIWGGYDLTKEEIRHARKLPPEEDEDE